MPHRFLTGLLAGTLALAAFACSNTESSQVKTVNATCPMMGGEVEPEGGTVEWHGHTVGFCCDGCSGKFSALSEAEQREKLLATGAELDG